VTESSPWIRREPPRDLADVGHEERLVERIRAEIAAAGPMTFARFMDVALYDPDHGYYRGPADRPGREGDFLTAPEADPIFGRVLARQLDEVWRRLGAPDRFVVREFGAGTGALAAALLDGLVAEAGELAEAVRYQPVEVDPGRSARILEQLAEAGHGARVEAASETPVVGAIVANEVLDALPVHRVERRAGRLVERFVDWRDGAFEDVIGPPSTPALEARLAAEGIALAEGQRAEVSLAVDDWVASAGALLERGLLLLVDYGDRAEALYDAGRRPHGTLRAYVRHRVHDDPYAHVGRQDLTAHVDVTAVERAAAAAGLERLGITSQARFLAALGAGDLLVALQSDPRTTLQTYLAARSALVRMLDPAAMGRFQVMAFGRGIDPVPPLRGLSGVIPNGR
jgi:SAM-dependent MidA family methyltransferase